MRFISILFFFFFCVSINSQSKRIKIIDSLSLESIPFASVYFSNNNGLISDKDGYFELIPEQFDTRRHAVYFFNGLSKQKNFL